MYVSVFVCLCLMSWGPTEGQQTQFCLCPSSQNIAPWGKQFLMNPPHPFASPQSKDSDTEHVAVLLSHSSHSMQCRGWAWAWTWPYSHVYQPPECPYYTARWRRQSTTGGAAPLAVSLCQDVCLLTNCPCAALEAKSGGKAPSMLQFVVIVKQYVRQRRR